MCIRDSNIPDWLKLTAEGRLEEAYQLSQSTNNMPEVCGRICPQDRLCEGNCVIEKSGHGTVTIGSVEKFITENAWANGWIKPIEVNNEKDEIIFIIGACPAGLAFDLNSNKGRIDIEQENGDMKATPYWPAVLTYVLPFTISGHPIVTMPIGKIGDIPLGVQVIGKRNGDDEKNICKKTYKYDKYSRFAGKSSKVILFQTLPAPAPKKAAYLKKFSHTNHTNGYWLSTTMHNLVLTSQPPLTGQLGFYFVNNNKIIVKT